MNWLRRLFVGTIARDIHDQIVDDLRAQLRDERDRSRRQMRTIIRMKVAGGSIPRALSGLRLPPRVQTPIEEAISAALDTNPRTRRPGELRNRHRSWAEREIEKDPANDRNTKRVLTKLRTWGVVDENDGDDDDDYIAVSSN